MSRRIILVIIIIFIESIIFSQFLVTGFVKDEENLIIPGVLITEKGTDNTTTTNLDGFYKITVSDSSTLVFSCLGYIEREIVVNGQREINATLKQWVIYEAWDQKLRFFLKSGILENPIGGQFEFAIPTFIDALSLYGDCSYQTNFQKNKYFDTSLRLNGVRLLNNSKFYLGVGIESNYRHITSVHHTFQTISFETLWWSNLPFDVFAGYSRINFDKAGVDTRNGILLGTELFVSEPMDLKIKGKMALVKQFIEYEAEIRKSFGKHRWVQSFVKYYNIDRYTELSLGFGVELTYYFKHQKNEY